MSKGIFRVGDRVWTLDGWGVVKSTTFGDRPYLVRLETKHASYSERELFFHEVEIHEFETYKQFIQEQAEENK